jgi:hypothetical protein
VNFKGLGDVGFELTCYSLRNQTVGSYSSLWACNYLSTEAVPFDIAEIIPAQSQIEMICFRRDEDKKNMDITIFWDVAPYNPYVNYTALYHNYRCENLKFYKRDMFPYVRISTFHKLYSLADKFCSAW